MGIIQLLKMFFFQQKESHYEKRSARGRQQSPVSMWQTAYAQWPFGFRAPRFQATAQLYAGYPAVSRCMLK